MNTNIYHSAKITGLMLFSSLLLAGCNSEKNNPTEGEKPLIIQEQGSFAAGGTVVTQPGTYDPSNPVAPAGQTLHGDHAYVFYQKPANARKYPIAFLHGAGQSAKTWESTPDGREGFQTIFLRKSFATYLIDQPRRGKAGRSTVASTLPAAADDQLWYEMFRLGQWPDFYPNVQFSSDPQVLEQFFRQMTPNTGAYDEQVIADAVSATFDRMGEGILVTHSQGGGPGWFTAIKNPKVRAVVAYEPGSGFIFPEDEVPQPMESSSAFGALSAVGIPTADFMKLTRIPIIIYYGDNIPTEPTEVKSQDNWRVRLAMAKLWVEAINRHGGDAQLVHLPEIGINGNTHFLFSDLNNAQIADLMAEFLKEKGLD